MILLFLFYFSPPRIVECIMSPNRQAKFIFFRRNFGVWPSHDKGNVLRLCVWVRGWEIWTRHPKLCLWIPVEAIEWHLAKIPWGIPRPLWLCQWAPSRSAVALELPCNSRGDTKQSMLTWKGDQEPQVRTPDPCPSTSLHTPTQAFQEEWAELGNIDLTDIWEH